MSETNTTTVPGTMMSNKAYDILKWVAQIVLPAVAAAYFGLSQIWGFPYGEEVVGTITVIDVLLGAILGISTSQYNKSSAARRVAYDGVMEVKPSIDDGKIIYNFVPNSDVGEWLDQTAVTFQVKKILDSQ